MASINSSKVLHNSLDKLESLSMVETEKLAELFKVFSDQTRLKIITVLFANELCVYDICHLLQLEQSAVSHQLRTLKSAHLVKYRRKGKQVFYSLDDEHVSEIFHMALDHIREEK